LIYTRSTDGGLTIGDYTWFFKIGMDNKTTKSTLFISKAVFIESNELLKTTFFMLFRALTPLNDATRQTMETIVLTKLSEYEVAKANKDKNTIQEEVENLSENKKMKLTAANETDTNGGKKQHDGHNTSCSSELTATRVADLDECSGVDSGNSSLEMENSLQQTASWPWSGHELGRLLHTLLYDECDKVQSAGSGLTGEVPRVRLSSLYCGMPDVVVKFFAANREKDWRDAYFREHIMNEIQIYTYLINKTSPYQWPSRIPVCFYAGKLDLLCGVVLEHVAEDARVSTFSSMDGQEKEACKAALHELHTCGILHRDVHYANFLLSDSSPGKAFIIDFGHSKICNRDENEHLFEEEKKLLEGKLSSGDDSVEQIVNK
jgi:hypothetical protein